MADVRNLLQAKRQESRISHRYASYNLNGQLKCLACGIFVRHPSAWEGHLGSKGHRLSVAHLREGELRSQDKSQLVGKAAETHQEQALKQGGERIDDDIPPKKRKLEQPPNILPADFFSDPTRIPSPNVENTVMESPDLESEYRRFQREILATPDYSETYERVTVVAEPQLFSEESPSNIGRESALAPAEKPAEDRKTEERELILDRLLEEERAQEEADMRVGLMKKRLEAVKRRRQALSQRNILPLK